VGSLVLLKHYVHHRLHHGSHGDCSCEHHHTIAITPLQIFSTAAALSVHALASGPILRNVSGITETSRLIPLLLASSALLGVFISLIVFVGESKRAKILRFLDTLPGIVTGTLVGICCYSLMHVVEHLAEPPPTVEWLFVALSAIVSLTCRYVMHARTTKPTVHLAKIGRASPPPQH
jgi:prepilin signal peptidase PulO-like enzyme (type II secretory pathway)